MQNNKVVVAELVIYRKDSQLQLFWGPELDSVILDLFIVFILGEWWGFREQTYVCLLLTRLYNMHIFA